MEDIDMLSDEVVDIAERLSSEGDVSYAEALKIAVGIQRNQIEFKRNQILARAFVTDTDNRPSALEAIAMQLGYKDSYIAGDDIVSAIYSLQKEE